MTYLQQLQLAFDAAKADGRTSSAINLQRAIDNWKAKPRNS